MKWYEEYELPLPNGLKTEPADSVSKVKSCLMEKRLYFPVLPLNKTYRLSGQIGLELHRNTGSIVVPK